MLDKIIELSLKYKLLVISLFVAIVFLGLKSYKDIPVDAFPDITAHGCHLATLIAIFP